MIIPEHITLDLVLSKCRECPDCGAMTLYPRSNKKRPPVMTFRLDGKEKQEYVRRVVWHLVHPNANMPDGIDTMVSSRCKNLHCVNPELVYRGSRSAVFKAAVKNGSWTDPAPKVRAVKARRAKSKLPDHGVDDIRASEESAEALAQRWGITSAYVHVIKRGKFRQPLVSPFAGLMA